MNQNVGRTDRIARFIAGPLLLLVGIAGYAGVVPLAFGPVPQALGGAVLVLFGVVFTVTATTQRCLLYSLFGVSTCATEN